MAERNGDLIIVDVKATSKSNFDWSETFKKYEYPKAYKRQLEMYQWLFKKNGFQSLKKHIYFILMEEKMKSSLINN